MSHPGQQKVENKDKYIGMGSAIGTAIPYSNRTFVPDMQVSPQLNEYEKETELQAQDRCGKLLTDLGWGNGFRIPFATKENQDLEKALEFRQRKILKLRSELLDTNEHVNALQQHLHRVNEDILSFKNILTDKKAVVTEETNFLGLAERIYNKTGEDKYKYNKRIEESLKRSEVMQKDLDRRLKGILELRDIIEFDSEALKEYQDRLKDYEESSGEIRKLSEEDARTVQELEDSRVELGAQRRELRHELDQEAMNTSKFQEQFDRMSVEFRKVHKQRHEMITMWASTINAMTGKDADMKEIADEYYETRKLLRGLTDSIDNKEKHLRQESCSIRGTQLFLSELDRRLGETRRRFQEEKDLQASLKDACSLCQMEVQHSCNQTKLLIEGLVKMDEEIKKFLERGDHARNCVMNLMQKLRDIEYGRSNADSRMAELERILDNEEKAAEDLIKEMDVLRKYFWERSNDKSITENEIRNSETTIQRILNNLEIMQQKEVSNLEYVAKRSGSIYRLDLECSNLDNRISKIINGSVDPEYFNLQQILRNLKETEKRAIKDRKYITSDLEHVQNLIHKCNTDIGKFKREQESWKAELLQCQMHSHGLEKLMMQAVKEYKDSQVHHSLERVYLKRLTDDLKNERQQMFGLAEIRNTIHWAVKERKAEIQNHRALNLSRQKALFETVSKLRIQVGEVYHRTDQLRGRFEMVTKLMGGSNEGDAEEQTLSYQVRKIARERENLQAEVTRWKNRLEEADKELMGLMNVFKIMNASNTALKDSLGPADEKSKERIELDQLNEAEKEIVLRKNRAKKYRAILKDRIDELHQQISVMDQEFHATTQLCQVKETLASKVENENQRQITKINRWAGMCTKILKEIKASIPPEQFELIQKDLKLRLTFSKFESAFAMLERVLVQHPYLKSFVDGFFQRDKSLIKIYYRLNKIVQPSASTFTASSASYSTYVNTTGYSTRTSPPSSKLQTGTEEQIGLDGLPDDKSHYLSVRMSPRSRLLNHASSKLAEDKSEPRGGHVSGPSMTQGGKKSMDSKGILGRRASRSKRQSKI